MLKGKTEIRMGQVCDERKFFCGREKRSRFFFGISEKKYVVKIFPRKQKILIKIRKNPKTPSERLDISCDLY